MTTSRTPPFDAFQRRLAKLPPGPPLALAGLPPSARAYALARTIAAGEGRVLVVAADEKSADRLAAELDFFLSGMRGPAPEDAPRVVRVPGDEILPYDGLSPDRNAVFARLSALYHLARADGPEAVVVGPRGLARRTLSPDVVAASSETLAAGGLVDRDELARRLVLAGYQNVPMVEDPGTFALRGGIVDVFGPLYEEPARIELFGDEVESIRFFDPETQRTTREAGELHLSPAREVLFTPEATRLATMAIRELAAEVARPTRQLRTLLDEIERGHAALGIEALLPAFSEGELSPLFAHLPGYEIAFVEDPLSVGSELELLWQRLESEFEAARARGELAFPPDRHYLDPEAALSGLEGYRRVEHHTVLLEDVDVPGLRLEVEPTTHLRREILDHHGEDGALTPLVDRLSRWRERGALAVVVCSGAGQADRLRRLLLERKVMAKAVEGPLDLSDPAALYDPAVWAWLVVGEVESGFVDARGGLALLSEADIFGTRTHARRRAARTPKLEEAFATAFRELKEGDLVVHVEHGIGRYGGLTRLSLRGVDGDFLLIEYAGKDRVYLPVHRLGQVQKYVGADAEHVRLDKLGGSAFALRKKKVKEELLKMAAELLDIYAARKAHPGTAFTAPDAIFREFEAEFRYDETEDQARAIDEVLSDMQKPEPMDRLVCGDVGFGKTEVAMRAAMKAVLDKKQVAVLVPTTVLAAQHDKTFRERFEGYPVIVETLSRFRSPKETREVLGRASEGKVDILIGTHRLLSKDVAFKDLGLIVVDEEQHFGVRQKERLKRLRRQVDVVTLTATPIPRTLHMSLSGIRDLSIIATPPRERRAIRTLVSRFDGAVIREAIERELARGGQVFVVHNRVHSIPAVEKYLRALMPELRLVVAHGQMHEHELERAMTAFVRREADVLLSTAIIESGLDIPTVNTIIVSRADTFGLSQLYQLRGRVGRSRERAYAYLLVPARRPITREAQQRLAVLQELTDLGAGLRLASHDLEIRGAGSLLGKEQSGHVSAVGFDLYAQMLDEAVRELRGEPPRDDFEPEVNLPVPAFLPEDWIPDVQQRLDFYKRLSQAPSEDALSDLRVELVDRYGEVPEEAENLMRVMRVKQGLSALRLRALESGPGRLVVTLGPDARIEPACLTALVTRAEREERGRLRLTPELKLVVRTETHLEGLALLDAADALLRELSGCSGEGEAARPRKRARR